METSIVRIFDVAGDVVGAGFAVSRDHVLTCAHVVARALGMQDVPTAMPHGELKLDFPLAGEGAVVIARPSDWHPIDPVSVSSKSPQDVAVLQLLTDPPASTTQCRPVSSTDLWGHGFRAFGFPPRRNDGVWAAGILRGRQATGWVQIEDVDELGYRVKPGFSGTPVWDEVLGGVVGMAVAADGQPENRAAYIISTDALVAAWPPLADQLTWPSTRPTDSYVPWPALRTAAVSEEDHSSARPVGSARWPFVGRSLERTLMNETLRTGRVGVVLSGPAGVGKTYLAQETLREAEQQGCSIAWVVATKSAASVPLGAFTHLLPQLPTGSLGRLDLLRQIGEELVGRAEGRRLLIGVDDAHLLDEASAALVHQLALSGTATVVVTLRAGEETPDAIVALWKDGLAERLDLDPLSGNEVSELLPRVLGAQVDTPTAVRLWRTTRGNPLFLRELVLAGLESRTLAATDGVWSWKGDLAMSSRLQEIVATRLGTLDGDQLALMETVAYGEPVSIPLLDAFVPSVTLETAERRGLVTVEASDRRTLVRPAHPLYSEAVRARCPLLRTRAVYRQLAAALEASGARRADDVLRVATYRLGAGEAGRPDLLLAGARRAFTMFDFQLCERLARAALNAGGGVPAKLMLAQTLVEQGKSSDTVKVLSDVEHSDLDEHQVADVSGFQAYALVILGQPEEAEQALCQAEDKLKDRALREQLMSIRARVLCLAGEPQRTIDIFAALQRESADERACARAASVATFAYGMVGRVDLALATAQRWGHAARLVAFDLPVSPLIMQVGAGLALNLAGRFAEAEEVTMLMHRESVSRNSEDARGRSAAVLGHVALNQGQVAGAVRWFREGAAAGRRPTRFHYLPACLAWLAQALVLAGDASGAEQALAEAEAAMNPAVASFLPYLTLGRAWLTFGQGDLSRARTLALKAAEEAEESGQHAFALEALCDLTRFGQPNVPGLERLASLVDGPLAPACVRRASASADRDGGRLDQAAEDFAAMGAHLGAAEAFEEAAAVHTTRGANKPALGSSTMARQQLEMCEGLDRSVFEALVALRSRPIEPTSM